MRVLHLCYERLPSPVHIGGGDVRRWQDLCSLTALGHEVHVVACAPGNEATDALRERAASVHVIERADLRRIDPRWWLARGLNPETLALALPNLHGLRDAVARVAARVRPALTWAEEASAVLLAPGPAAPGWAPIVHSHLDFMFKLRPVRRAALLPGGKRLRRPDALSLARLERLEVDLCRRAAYTVCASQSEARYLGDRGIPASYLPVVGPTTPRPRFDRLSAGRLFLFGNPNTAMRAARQNLREEVWPIVQARGLELDWHQLGKTPRPGADPSWPWVERHCTVHGFVPNLDDVLAPGDASLMPYPFDTGGRAKFAVAAGYGVVNVAYEKTFECASEFTHGQDCLAARDPAHLVDLLADFTSDATLRRRLAEGSRAVYERCHTQEAQLPAYEAVLRSALAATSPAADVARARG
ncbi:MAG: hypothetical protein KC543_12370 [Myxococcales bacterium]|nr:hypothetical protein [Myxococcales bacterium]